MEWMGDKVTEDVIAAGIKALRESAEHVGTEANKTAPIDEGTLRRSMGVSVDESEGQAVISYDTEYALRLHEETGFRFSDPSARRKWLELTVQEQQAAVRNYIVDAIKAAMG